jgi:predicted nucleic acid-binding protein
MRTSRGEYFLTTFGELEVVNAFGLRVFRGEATVAQARSSVNDFEKDLSTGVFQVCGLADKVFERARQLSRQTTAKIGTRASDLLHVAAAVELGMNSFFTFDRQQRKLAHSVRLKLN